MLKDSVKLKIAHSDACEKGVRPVLNFHTIKDYPKQSYFFMEKAMCSGSFNLGRYSLVTLLALLQL